MFIIIASIEPEYTGLRSSYRAKSRKKRRKTSKIEKKIPPILVSVMESAIYISPRCYFSQMWALVSACSPRPPHFLDVGRFTTKKLTRPKNRAKRG